MALHSRNAGWSTHRGNGRQRYAARAKKKRGATKPRAFHVGYCVRLRIQLVVDSRRDLGADIAGVLADIGADQEGADNDIGAFLKLGHAGRVGRNLAGQFDRGASDVGA